MPTASFVVDRYLNKCRRRTDSYKTHAVQSEESDRRRVVAALINFEKSYFVVPRCTSLLTF